MKKRRLLIAANWKLNKTIAETEQFGKTFAQQIRTISEVDTVVCPPFTALKALDCVLSGSNVALGAQDVFWVEGGAYTGEISSSLLKDVGCKYVIIGHSERRKYFNELDEFVNKKTLAALKNNLVPIVCVGETLAERQENKTEQVLLTQVKGAFVNFTAEQAMKVGVAYEPVWAIGTGNTASPQQAQEAHSFIRKILKADFGNDVAGRIRILYGGSVKPDNTKELMAQPDIDGALVGGASLDVVSFIEITRNAKAVALNK